MVLNAGNTSKEDLELREAVGKSQEYLMIGTLKANADPDAFWPSFRQSSIRLHSAGLSHLRHLSITVAVVHSLAVVVILGRRMSERIFAIGLVR